MTTKFDKVMQNLQDSYRNTCDPMHTGERWCLIKPCELSALMSIARAANYYSIYSAPPIGEAVELLAVCADE